MQDFFFILRRLNPYLYIFLIFLYKKFSIFFFFIELKKFLFLKKIKKNLAKSYQILDVGSNKGQISKLINFFFPNSLCILEFDPYNNNFIRNKKNIIFYNFGLGSVNKKKKIYIPYYKNFVLDSYISTNKNIILSNLKRDRFNIKNISFKKKICHFKKLDNFNVKPFFIKIDTEGSEYDILVGGKKTIRKYNPIILLEVNSFHEFRKICSYLKKNHKYDPFIFLKNKFQKINFVKNIKRIQGDYFFLSKKSFRYIN